MARSSEALISCDFFVHVSAETVVNAVFVTYSDNGDNLIGLDNDAWVDSVRSGSYRERMKRQYM